MNAVESTRFSVAKAFVIGLVIVLAGIVGITNMLLAGPGATYAVPAGLFDADESVVEGMDGTRGAGTLNGDGNDYVQLYDVNDVIQIQIDGALHGVNDIYVGEPDVQLDIPVESIKSENWNDNDGDDILYNVSMSIDETATTYWDSEGCCWVEADEDITWDVDTITPTYKEDNSNGGNALLADGIGSKYIPWFYNDYDTPGFLDYDNDQRADNSEFYRIYDDYKVYEGFQFDVAGDAEPGIYNISVEVTYIYQTFQNVSTQRLSGGGGGWYDPDSAGPGGTGDLGIFDYYFWEPFNTAGGSVDFNVPGNINFRKRADYYETNAAPVGANWECIPDLGYNNDNPNNYNAQGGTWDYHSNYDQDGVTSWNDGGAGTLNTVVSSWNNRGINDYANGGQSYIDRTVDQYPYSVYDGNGTWRYSGYEGDTVWTTIKTEIEYIEIEVEHCIRISEPSGDGCELVPDNSDPYYLKAGDDFKKMYMRINNLDSNHHMTDVFVNISLTDQSNFNLKHDWAWKSQVDSGNFDNFYYRLYALNGTPVGRYSGTVTITYTREHVRCTEELPLEYILYFTPDLRNHGGVEMTQLEVSKVIHTGQAETNVDFSIANNGNTLLENGLLTMDFSDFKHKGDEYTDPEGGEGTYTQTLELPSINYGPTAEKFDVSVDVEIPDHWSLSPGVYKLLMNYEGYYFNDGVLGEPTNYVKVWMNWYDDDFNSNTDMNSYVVIDTDGDENMDIFTQDETRAADGIFMYVEVEDFVPNTPELKIVDVSINDGTDIFEQGSITNGKIELTLSNTGVADISECYVELDLEGYFKGKQYYEGYLQNVENPEDYIVTLNMGNTEVAELDIEGIDQLLPPGTHRLKLKYTYSYDNGSTPSEISTDNGELYFNITVTDSSPDVIPTVSSSSGLIRVGDKLVDINLYVNLANREYYDLSYVTATLTVGDDTPFIPGENATLSGTTDVLCKWNNPANNFLSARGQNMNNMYFNLNLHPQATKGTYYLDLTLDMYNERTLTTVTVPTQLEVKIYPKQAKLRITDVTVSTGSVTPGREFTLDCTIINDGGEAARDIYVEFKEAYVSGSAYFESHEDVNPTGAKYPFSSDIMIAYISEIQPYSTGQATFTVIGDLNIYPGVTYFQNIEFDYKDSMGSTYTSTDIVPIQSDSSVKARVDGEKYVWDTDREAWISEAELAAEEVFDYTPWMISIVVAIWLVTLLMLFMFVIRPKYKNYKRQQSDENAEEMDTSLRRDDQDLKSPLDEPEHLESETETEQLDEDGNVIDYRSSQAPTATPAAKAYPKKGGPRPTQPGEPPKPTPVSPNMGVPAGYTLPPAPTIRPTPVNEDTEETETWSEEDNEEFIEDDE